MNVFFFFCASPYWTAFRFQTSSATCAGIDVDAELGSGAKGNWAGGPGGFWKRVRLSRRTPAHLVYQDGCWRKKKTFTLKSLGPNDTIKIHTAWMTCKKKFTLECLGPNNTSHFETHSGKSYGASEMALLPHPRILREAAGHSNLKNQLNRKIELNLN